MVQYCMFGSIWISKAFCSMVLCMESRDLQYCKLQYCNNTNCNMAHYFKFAILQIAIWQYGNIAKWHIVSSSICNSNITVCSVGCAWKALHLDPGLTYKSHNNKKSVQRSLLCFPSKNISHRPSFSEHLSNMSISSGGSASQKKKQEWKWAKIISQLDAS